MVINNHASHFVGFNLGFEIFLKKREYQKNGALKYKIEASLYTLYWGFKKISFKLYTYVLDKILQNGAKFIQRLSLDIKNHTADLNNFRQAAKSPKC